VQAKRKPRRYSPGLFAVQAFATPRSRSMINANESTLKDEYLRVASVAAVSFSPSVLSAPGVRLSVRSGGIGHRQCPKCGREVYALGL